MLHMYINIGGTWHKIRGTMEFFLNVFTEFDEFIDKSYLSLKGLEPAISCVRNQDVATVPSIHMWGTGSLNWAQIMLQWFIRFSEFVEITGFNERSAPFRKISIVIQLLAHLFSSNGRTRTRNRMQAQCVVNQYNFLFVNRLLQNGNITNPICKLFTLYFQDRRYPMFHPQLGFVVIVNNLRSQVPHTAHDVQALRSALETVGFNVKCYDDCNVQVNFSIVGECFSALYSITLQSLHNMKCNTSKFVHLWKTRLIS